MAVTNTVTATGKFIGFRSLSSQKNRCAKSKAADHQKRDPQMQFSIIASLRIIGSAGILRLPLFHMIADRISLIGVLTFRCGGPVANGGFAVLFIHLDLKGNDHGLPRRHILKLPDNYAILIHAVPVCRAFHVGSARGDRIGNGNILGFSGSVGEADFVDKLIARFYLLAINADGGGICCKYILYENLFKDMVDYFVRAMTEL